MITCKYSSKKINKKVLIVFILSLFCFLLILSGLLINFFNVYDNNISPIEYKKVFAISFFAIIMILASSIILFKELNWYRNVIFEIWDNKLVCNCKNKDTVINYSDINYIVINNNDKNNIDCTISINYRSNKKMQFMQFRSFLFENKEDSDILMSYFEITNTEPYWFLLKKVFVKVKE